MTGATVARPHPSCAGSTKPLSVGRTALVARTIVIVARLIVPVSIFRWPLAGGVASMVLDGLDVVLVDVLANLLGVAPT